MSTTFITGATGLLGAELVDQILRNSDYRRIVCLVRDFVPTSRFFTEGMDKRVAVVMGDVRDEALLKRVLNEYDVETVYHLAAQTLVTRANADPTETLDVNIRGTWAMLEAIRTHRSVKAAVVASSDKAYGDLQGNKYDETFPLQGKHPYDVSKSCTDLITQMFAASYGLNAASVRCGNLFGPGDLNENRIFPSTILSILKNQRPVIRSDGKFIRDYIYVADAAAAYRTLAKKLIADPKLAGPYNFSYGLRLTVLEVVESIKKHMGSSLQPIVLDEAKNEIPIQCLDSAKAMRKLGWKPELGFEEGVRLTIAWYRSFMAKEMKRAA